MKILAALAGVTLVLALLFAGYARRGAVSVPLARLGATQPMPETIGISEAPPRDAVKTAPSADSAALSVAQRSGATGPATTGAANVAGGAGQASVAQQPLPPFAPLSPSAIDRMIVKTGVLSVQLAENADALSSAVQRVNAVVAGIPGAYVAASSTTYRAETPGVSTGPARDVAPSKPMPIVPPQPQPSTTATLTLKVPVDAFDQAMQRLRELGSPLAENVSTQEVTEEYVDLEAQVRNLEATEQQYLRFLERAQRIEEMLPIQQRLSEVRGQIERLRGRMTLLQRRSDVSTITVSLVVPGGKGAGAVDGEPRAIRTLKEAWTHLSVALSGALDLVIYLAVYALPLVPVIAAVVWWRRRQARPAAAATAGGAI